MKTMIGINAKLVSEARAILQLLAGSAPGGADLHERPGRAETLILHVGR